MPRILFAALSHETHSFVDETTPLADFRRRDAAGIMARRGDLSVVDGFLIVAEREGWEVVPTLDWGATPSGTVEQEVFETFWRGWTASTWCCTAPCARRGWKTPRAS
jgi:microcystin degradation protein MlrC